MPSPGMDMSFAAGWNGACPAAKPGSSRGRGSRAPPAALSECRTPDAWHTGALLTVARRSYAPVAAASFEAMPRMTSGA